MTGLVDKKVGFLIHKARQLILYDEDPPRLTYYDPTTNAKKVLSCDIFLGRDRIE